MNDAGLSPAPTRARYVVLAFLCAMAFILYLDRICISQAAPEIKRELAIDDEEMSFVFMAFTLAYGLFEVPTGRLGDRFGSRRVLTRIVVWWSAFTALTGACFQLGHLLVVRFLFGAGEAGAYPNAARIFARWFNGQERGRLNGIMLTCALLGGALSPMVAARLIGAVGWRWTFVIFGAIGVFWAVFFYLWFRDDPAQHPACNDAELQVIGGGRFEPHHDPIPWRLIRTNRNCWLLGTIMTLGSFVFYFYISWYPTYLQEARGVSRETSGDLASLVLGLATLGTFIGGFVASWLNSRADKQRLRSALCSVLFVVAAGFLYVSMICDDATFSAFFAGLSCMTVFSYQSHWWACLIELAGKHVGALFGLLNGVGVFGAMGSQYFFGAFGKWRAQLEYVGRDKWDPAFYLYVLVLLAGAIAWLFVDTSQPLEKEVQPARSEQDDVSSEE